MTEPNTEATEQAAPIVPAPSSILDTPANTSGKPKRIAQAWLNISVPLADGTAMKLPVGIPLHTDNRRESALIEAMRKDPEKVLELVGTVIFTDGTVTSDPLVIEL